MIGGLAANQLPGDARNRLPDEASSHGTSFGRVHVKLEVVTFIGIRPLVQGPEGAKLFRLPDPRD